MKNSQINTEEIKNLIDKNFGDAGTRYGLSWAGKKNCFYEIAEPTTKTLTPEEYKSVDFENTQNIFIEGENLEVLKVLQGSYFNKIKMIYIDPPYNTGKDFVYKDSFQRKQEQEDQEAGLLDENEKGEKVLNSSFATNSKSNGRYHSNWLNMMYPRLFLARNLLKDDGVIFISIDDNEVANLRLICDEIFGEENFVAEFIWKGGKRNAAKHVSVSHEYILFYAKDLLKISELDISWKVKKEGLQELYKKSKDLLKESSEDYNLATKKFKLWFKSLSESNPLKDSEHYSNIDSKGLYYFDNISREGGGRFDIKNPFTGKTVKQPSRGWIFSKEEDFWKSYNDGYVIFSHNEDNLPSIKRYLHESEEQILDTVFYKDRRAASSALFDLMNGDYFDFPKDISVISKLILSTSKSSDSDIILDFFAGSGTTGHAVMDLNAEDILNNKETENVKVGNRKYICVQLPEVTDEKSEAYKAGYKNISEITRERLRRAGKKIEDKVRVENEKNKTDKKVDTGFKSFVLTQSHFPQWIPKMYKRDDENREANLLKDLEEYVDSTATGTDIEKAYELIVKNKKDINAKLVKKALQNKSEDTLEYFVVGSENELVIVLTDAVNEDDIKEIINSETQMKKLVMNDKCFVGKDAMKTNVRLQLDYIQEKVGSEIGFESF